MSARTPLLAHTQSTESEADQPHIRHDEADSFPTVSPLRGYIIGAAVFVLIFILTTGISVLTTIQSSVAADLNVSDGASWFVTAYLIATTSVTPVAGKLCQIFSPKVYLIVSSLIQVIGLLITAFAPSFSVFLIGRAVCGTGAAAITPVAFILVTELASERRRGLLFGLVNCGYTAGIAIGAVIGGELEQHIGWRAVFWTQTPLCLAASITAFLAIPSGMRKTTSAGSDQLSSAQKVARIDFLGVVTLIGSMVLLLFTLASPKFQAIPFILAILLLALCCLVETKWAVEPIVPPSVISSRAMLLTGFATIGFMCARWEILFYTPMYGIAVLGWSQIQAGTLLIPTNTGFGLGSVAVGWLHIRKTGSYYTSCLVTMALFLLEQYGVSRLLTSGSPIWLLVSALFVNGFIAGAFLTYTLAHLLYITRPSQHIIVIPLNAMFRSLSGSIGSSVAGGIFVRSLQDTLHSGFEKQGLYGRGELIQQLLSRPALVQQLSGAEHEVAVSSYATSLGYLLGISCLWVIAMFVLQTGVGWTAPEDFLALAPKRRPSLSSRSSTLEREPLVN